MEILIVGEEQNAKECQAKFGEKHQYHWTENPDRSNARSYDVVFDFNPANFHLYAPGLDCPLFLNVATTSWKQLLGPTTNLPFPAFGFAGLPTFLDREILEVSLPPRGSADSLRRICDQLGTQFQVVADQAGLITPRVICMIINEAFFTFQDGTASKEDIDLAMKLGTSYPYGPFEWCEKIGRQRVMELLESVYKATGNARYEICPLLKK